MERKKISGKLAQRRKDKEEFIKISKQAILLTSVLLAFIFGVRYQLKQPRIIYVAETATSTATTTSKQAKIAPKNVEKAKPVDSTVSQEKLEIVRKIATQFPTNRTVMVSIALQESQLNPKAIGYNCRYGKVVLACKPEDRGKAISKDGGVFQINNFKAKDLNVDENIAQAKIKYDTQGLTAWCAYTSGAYKQHIPEAQRLLAML